MTMTANPTSSRSGATMTEIAEVNLTERLRFHADRMEEQGHLNAARYMRHGADEIEAWNRRPEGMGADVEKMREALAWVGQVYPETSAHGGAIVSMAWDEFNAMREAIGLNPVPARSLSGKHQEGGEATLKEGWLDRDIKRADEAVASNFGRTAAPDEGLRRALEELRSCADDVRAMAQATMRANSLRPGSESEEGYFVPDDVMFNLGQAIQEADAALSSAHTPAEETEPTLRGAALPANTDAGWREIESAPKDGTSILVCMTHNLPCVGWETVQWVDWRGGPYEWPIYRERIDIPFPPTHWMPLPPPPAGEKEG